MERPNCNIQISKPWLSGLACPRLATWLILLASTVIGTSATRAQTITTWNFNSNPPDSSSTTGSLTPSTGAGTLSLLGGTTSTFATGSPGDPASTDNTGLNTQTYPAQGTGSGTAGVQFNVSTATSTGQIQISLDFRESATASRYFQLQLSQDGTTFTNASGGTAAVGSSPSPNTATSFTSMGLYSDNAGTGSQTFVQGISYTLPANSVYANDANFAFRWVAVFDPANNTSYTASNSTYGTTGSARFDDVSVSQVPEPATVLGGLFTLGCLGWSQRRRLSALFLTSFA